MSATAQKKAARVAIYARYSSTNQATDSADTQIERVRGKVASGSVHSKRYPDCRLEIDAFWIEKDEAKTGTTAGRDGYQRILAGLERNHFDILLVDDLSRLTRDLGDMIHLYENARYYGVEVISICEGVSSEDDSAKMAFTMRGFVNDLANETHAKRVISRMETHFENGFAVGHVPYGFLTEPTEEQERGGRKVPCRFMIKIHPERAAAVLRIYQLAADGLGRQAIANVLNRELIPSPTKSHLKDGPVGKWSESTIRNILCNERYAGIWRYRMTSMSKNPKTGRKAAKENRPQDIVWMKHEIAEALRIVPQEIWNQIAERREGTRRTMRQAQNRGERLFGDRCGKSGADYLLSGLLRCAECGANLVLVGGKAGGYYGCSRAHQGTHSCQNRALVARKRVESGVVDALVKTLSQKAWLIKLARRIEVKRAEAQGCGPQNRATIRKELERLDKEIENFMNVIARGTFTEAMAVFLSGHERRKKLLESELRKLAEVETQKGKITPELLLPRLRNLIEKIAENPISVRVALKGLFPEGIKLTPPKDKAHGFWRADLSLDGGNVVFLESFRRGNADNSRPRYSKPPDLSEGCEFIESALGSAARPIAEPIELKTPGSTGVQQPQDSTGLSVPMLDLSVREPLCILLYPDRTEVIFQERRQVVSKRTRTVSGDLARAHREAENLRALGARVSVYRVTEDGKKRVLIEARLRLETGKLTEKHTRYCRTEGESVAYLHRLAQVVAQGCSWDALESRTGREVG